MKKGGGKNKGSSFEREVCKKLSLWWTQDKPEPRDDIFYRTASSGGRATQRKKNNKETSFSEGDVGLLDPIGQPFLDFFVIEIKRGYSDQLNLLDFIDGTGGFLLNFWKKIFEISIDIKKDPMLIFKRNRKTACVLFRYTLMYQIRDFCGNFYGKEIRFRDINLDWQDAIILPFDEFLTWAKPAAFRRI